MFADGLDSKQPLWSKILTILQDRIMDGTYPVGTYLPSEWQLVDEFGVSRPIIGRALNLLRDEGWVTSSQGKGRLILRRGGYATRKPGWGLWLVTGETSPGTVGEVSVENVFAPNRAVAGFGWDTTQPVVARRRMLVDAHIGPLGVVTVYVPAEVAMGTDLMRDRPVRGGVLSHLTQRRRIRFDSLAQQISSRPVTAQEADELQVPARACATTILVSVADDDDVVQVVADALLVASRIEIRDAFPLR
jgi:GntR family transcriptional regulator